MIANTLTSTEAAVERLLPGYRKRVVLLLTALLVARFWLCQTTPFEITGEEAYAWMKGRFLDWGYWDQGPLTPALIRLGTFFFHDTELGVRWLAAALMSATGFLLFYVVRQAADARAAFWSVVLLAVTPLFAWRGLLMTDGTVALGLMALVLVVSQRLLKENRPVDWLALGVLSGLALLTSWWHGAWVLGGLLFLLKDEGTRSDVRGLRGVLAAVGGLVGLIPWLVWRWQPELKDVQGAAPEPGLLPWHSWFVVGPDLLVKYWAVWLLPLAALGLLAWLGRERKPLGRIQELWLFLSFPAMASQSVASCFHEAHPGVWLAFCLPLVPLTALMWSNAGRSHRGIRRVGHVIVLLGLAQTVGGFVPEWSHEPIFYSGLYLGPSWRTMAQSVVRTQKETGASLVIADHPFVASALTFYLPFRPFVYVAPRVGISSQYDLWVSYSDNRGAAALLVARGENGVPEQVRRQFRTVTPLPEPNLGEAATGWVYTFCEDYGGDPSVPKEVPEPSAVDLPLPK